MKEKKSQKGRPKFKRTEGYQYTKTFSKPVVNELLIIKDREKSGLTGENVLKYAINPRNPLHKLFDWDNSIASEKWRLYQAYQIVNKIKVVIEGKLYNGFESLKVEVDNEFLREYKPMLEIRNDKELREQLIQTALIYLNSWKIKYQNIVELKPLVSTINKFQNKYKVKRSN